MEVLKEACATDILVDFKEDILSLHANSKETFSGSDYLQGKTVLRNTGNGFFNMKQKDLETILDASPFETAEDNDFNLKITLKSDKSEAIVKLRDSVDDCPTGILIDVPSTTSFDLKQNFTTDNTHLEENLNQDLNNKVSEKCDMGSYSEKDFADCSPKFNEVNEQGNIQRLRWNTPSPQSMSRITKEASEIVHNLNSSIIFDDDSLLTEEILPLPINFDNSDIEDSIEKEEDIINTEGIYAKEILISSANVQAEDVVVMVKEVEEAVTDKADIPNSINITACENFQKSPVKQCLSKQMSELGSEDTKQYDCNFEKCVSSEVCTDSLNKSEFSSISDGPEDVFLPKNSSEDKENLQREHTVLPRSMKMGYKTPCKAIIKPNTKPEHRESLRNVSNIKHEVTSSPKCAFPKASKSVITPSRKLNATLSLPSTRKQQVESQNKLKAPSWSNSTRGTRELISNVQKPCATIKRASLSSNSFCKSSSSDCPQLPEFSKMKTPIKRQSICIPSKSFSAMKPPQTPLLHRFQNSAAPRFTPQPAGVSKFGFSKSWQQPTGASHFSNLKQRNCTPITDSTNVSKVSSGKTSSSNQKRQSFSQSMSAVSFHSLGKNALSTSNKNRMSSKLNLPSPFTAKQERNLARVLFPSAAKK